MKKKQVLAMVMALTLTVGSLAACGSDKSADTSADAQVSTETKTDETASTQETTTAASTDESAKADDADAVDPHDWAEYDNLIAEIKSTTDFEEREALMHKAEDMLMETGALLPIYYYNDIYMQKPDVSNIYSNLFGFKFFMFADTDKDTLRLNLASEPDSVDPALNSSVDGACMIVNSFAGLCTYDADGNLANDLAESIDVSDDGLTYTVKLLPDLKWSDGSTLDANDFVYAWNRAVAPETAADYAYMFDAVKANDDGTLDVTASEDGSELTIVLNAPCAYFQDLLAFPAYYPVKKDAVESSADYATNPGAWCQEAGYVTNGAYTMSAWKHDESITFTKNPNYHRADEVKVETLEFMLSADDTAIYAAYNAGDLDFIDSVPTDEIASLLDNPEFHIIDNLGTYYVSFNVKSPLFDGKTAAEANAMRRAFALLIDREYIAENIGQTGQVPANAFIPEGMADGHGGVFKSNDAAYTYPDEASVGYFDPAYSDENVAKAIELLESAGFVFGDDGKLSADTPISFEYLTNESKGHVAIAEAIQQDLEAVGITMTIKTCDWNVFLDERKSGNYDIARNGWIADFNDPINMLEMWMTNSGNNDAQFGR